MKPRASLEEIQRYAAVALDLNATFGESVELDTLTRYIGVLVQMAAYPDHPDVNRDYTEERWIELPHDMWQRIEGRLPSDIRDMVYAVNYEMEEQVRIPIRVTVHETVKHYRVCPHKGGPLKAHTEFLLEGEKGVDSAENPQGTAEDAGSTPASSTPPSWYTVCVGDKAHLSIPVGSQARCAEAPIRVPNKEVVS